MHPPAMQNPAGVGAKKKKKNRKKKGKIIGGDLPHPSEVASDEQPQGGGGGGAPGSLQPRTIGGDLPHPSAVAPDGQPQGGSAPGGATSSEEVVVDAHAAFREKFLQFLNEFTRPGEAYPYYKAQVAMLMELDHYKLEVDFDDLKTKLWEDREYLEVIFQIVNHPESTKLWMKPVITGFMKNEGVAIDDERLEQEAEVLFINKPQSIRMLKDHLEHRPVKKKIRLLSEVTAESCTLHGRLSFLSVLCPLLMDHSANKSYGGQFGPDDIVVVDSNTCWILKTPHSNAQAADKSSDLQKLWTIMEEKFNEGGSLPLYMDDLRSNLSNATSEEEWFLLYLEFHPALMPSLARRNFLVELNHNIQGLRLRRSARLGIFAAQVPVTDPTATDWIDEVQKGTSNKMKAVLSEKKRSGKVEQYDATYKSQLLYMRHLLKHLNRQCQNLKHLDEIELYCSTKIPNLLPRLLKDLLRFCKNEMFFYGLFEIYKAEQNSYTDVPRSLFC